MLPLVPVLLAASLAAPAPKGGPPELAHVPPDAALVVHARLADLWKSDGLATVRKIILKAGPDALATLDRRFAPAPSSADRVTAYVVAPADGEDLQFVGLFTFTKAFDRDAVVKAALPKGRPMKGKKSEWYGDAAADAGVLFVDDRTVAFGNHRGIARLADGRPAGPAVAAAFPELADPGKLLTVAANPAAVPPRFMEDLSRFVPAELRPLLEAKAVVLSLDGGADGAVHVRLTYRDKAAADAAGKALQDGLALARRQIAEFREELKKKVEGDGKPAGLDALPEALLGVAGLGVLQEAEDLLVGLPVKRDGASFTLAVPVPAELRPLVLGAGLATGVAVPAVQRVRQAANRMKDSNNLKQFALAVHNYCSVNNDQMPGAICDKADKPLLSWRVAILPYIEQENLYKQFKLDEPWDSENNKKLIDKMPKIFEVPGAPVKAGHTHYRTFVGEKGSWKKYADTVNIAAIPDGTSNTWMVGEAEEAVVWTKPDELPADGKTPPKLGKFFGGGFNVAFWDGSVRYFPAVPKGVFKYIDPGDGEVIGPADEK